MIRVQREAFDVAAELAALKSGNTSIGASAIFVGTVRELSGDETISTMTLEHYPGMTEKALQQIEAEAAERWPLISSLIIHRYGELAPGDDIVLVMTTSRHREAAFEACQFLMDWLKTKAPFWKLEAGDSGTEWVEARASDDAAAERWRTKTAE
jgi:molybdopterin synthase catalytic subunit